MFYVKTNISLSSNFFGIAPADTPKEDSVTQNKYMIFISILSQKPTLLTSSITSSTSSNFISLSSEKSLFPPPLSPKSSSPKSSKSSNRQSQLLKIQNEALKNALNLKCLICDEVIVELKNYSVKDGIISSTHNKFNLLKYINFKKIYSFFFFFFF
jgi:hypothetical protein